MTNPFPSLQSGRSVDWDPRDLSFLLETSLEFASARQIEPVLEGLSRRILEVVPASRSGILLLDEDGVRLAAGYEGRFSRSSHATGQSLDLDQYPEIAIVRDTGDPLVIADVPADARMKAVRDQVKLSGLRSLLCVPLQTPEAFLGILSIGQFHEPRSFSDREIALCRTIANQAAAALENAYLYELLRSMNEELESQVESRTRRLTRSLEQMSLLYEIVHESAASTSVDEIAHKAVELLRASFSLYGALLAFHDEETGRFRIVASCSEEPHAKALGEQGQGLDEGICGHVVRTGKSYLTSDTDRDPYFIPTPLTRTRSELCVPLRVGTKVIGVLDIQSDERYAFHEQDRTAMEAIADTLGVAVRTSQLFVHAERARAFMDAVIENLTGGLIVTDREGVVRRTNLRAREILRFEAEEIEGKPLIEVIPDAGPMFKFESDVSAREIALTTRDGEKVAVGFSNAFFASREGMMDAVLISFQDLSEIKSLQERVRHRERLATIGEVATAIAHEVRNPLFGITATAQTLALEHPEGSDGRELIEALLSETQRLDGLVEQLLSYGRPARPIVGAVDLSALCRELVELNVEYARTRGIQLMDSVAERVSVVGDRDQLKGAILNLLKNGMDAAASSLRFRLSLDGDQARLDVEDDGQGIEAGDQEKVFELYFTTKGGAGTGMGLPLCRKVARDHGGDVSCEESQLGGALFSMRIPLQLQGASDGV